MCLRVYVCSCVCMYVCAGLQLAYFLHKAGRDYIIFERNDTAGKASHTPAFCGSNSSNWFYVFHDAGSFYQHYPRHRTLISINKRNTGEGNRREGGMLVRCGC